jgi:hypothetical protein
MFLSVNVDLLVIALGSITRSDSCNRGRIRRFFGEYFIKYLNCSARNASVAVGFISAN